MLSDCQMQLCAAITFDAPQHSCLVCACPNNRLLHPLSPSGKLVYLGLEGLEASNRLLNAASSLFNDQSESSSLPSIVLQDSVYRVALSTEQQVSLQALASTNREALEAANVRCQWLSPGELNGILDESYPSTKSDSPRSHFGALVLSGNARVIHVPSYLQGLWKACCHISNQTSQWILTDQLAHVSNKDWLERLQNEFDVVVLAAGAGLFQPPHVSEGCGGETTSQNPHVLDSEHSLIGSKDFPVQLVRGQSVEMQRQQGEEISPSHLSPLPPALVCGKYVLPTLRNDRILVGATHEFQSVPWTTDRVLQELRERTTELLPNIWETRKETDVETDAVKWEIAQVSSGMRVQANRSAHGRLPIIGRLHSNIWIFTGLSSRGLLYHGLFGDYLTNSILNSWTDKLHDPHGCNEFLSEEVPVSQPVDLDWWRKKTGVKH